MSEGKDVGEFGESFRRFMESMAATPGSQVPPFLALFTEHFGQPPQGLSIVGEKFPSSEHPNVQLALDRLTGPDDVQARWVGVQGAEHDFAFSMSALLRPSAGVLMGDASASIGPVVHATCERGKDDVISCVQRGVLLLAHGDERHAILVKGPSDMGWSRSVSIEVMATSQTKGEGLLAELRRHMRELDVYRGKAITLSVDRNEGIRVQFRRLPQVSRAGIILPQGLLDRIERHTIRFAELGPRLRAAGRHLKRGMLLHGPPGTGKTLTAMYLASRMQGRTVVVITGRGAGLIEHACALARYLEPATVILEDVDLIAEDRSHSAPGCGVLLFELLNEMDGIAADADILFVLTTNRPEILEPALAARPGRVDQAIEIPLPDAEGRRRLIELYGEGLRLEIEDMDALLRRSEGVSAAFIRELLRKAALLAIDGTGDGSEVVVSDAHLDEAFRELVVLGGELTRSLLGASPAHG